MTEAERGWLEAFVPKPPQQPGTCSAWLGGGRLSQCGHQVWDRGHLWWSE